MRKKAKQKIEHGIDHQDDPKLYRRLTFNQNVTGANGEVKKSQVVKKQVRDRITNLAIPVGEKGRITYTDWKYVKQICFLIISARIT